MSLNSVRAGRDAYLTSSDGSVFSGSSGRTNLSAGRDAKILAGQVVGSSTVPFGVNIPGVLSISAGGSIGGYSVVIAGPNNLVLLNQPPGKVLDNSTDNGGVLPADQLYLQAISNADDPFIANVPGFYTRMLLMVVFPGDVEPVKDLIVDAPLEKGLYLTPVLHRGE
jgi:hypothetical protein